VAEIGEVLKRFGHVRLCELAEKGPRDAHRLLQLGTRSTRCSSADIGRSCFVPCSTCRTYGEWRLAMLRFRLVGSVEGRFHRKEDTLIQAHFRIDAGSRDRLEAAISSSSGCRTSQRVQQKSKKIISKVCDRHCPPVMN
jgi:hypothetical protein